MADLKPATRLRIERVRAGWRIGALAAETGLSRRNLYRIESGSTAPRLKTRERLAAALNVPERTLFGTEK